VCVEVGWNAKTYLVGPIDGAKTINSVEMVFSRLLCFEKPAV